MKWFARAIILSFEIGLLLLDRISSCQGACDVNCASGCAIRGPGKCDSSCKKGHLLITSSASHTCYTCRAMNYFSIQVNEKYNRVALNLSTRNSIVISIKISTDFNVGLTRDQDSYAENIMYRVLVGGWTNTHSVIRKSHAGADLVSVSTLILLDANYFNSFWISWINGVIRVGKGSVVGNDMFLSYNDVSPSAFNYVAFTCYNFPGSAFFNNVCDTNCISGCSVQGPKKCDSACSSGFVLITGNAYTCAGDSTNSDNKILHRHSNVRLAILSTASSVIALSPTHCCTLCRKISGCRSVNYRRRSSKGDVNCVPLGVSAITVCMTVSDPSHDWDWFSVDT